MSSGTLNIIILVSFVSSLTIDLIEPLVIKVDPASPRINKHEHVTMSSPNGPNDSQFCHQHRNVAKIWNLWKFLCCMLVLVKEMSPKPTQFGHFPSFICRKIHATDGYFIQLLNLLPCKIDNISNCFLLLKISAPQFGKLIPILLYCCQ